MPKDQKVSSVHQPWRADILSPLDRYMKFSGDVPRTEGLEARCRTNRTH